MAHKIVKNVKLNSSVRRLEIHAEDIANKALPGQFIVLRIDEKGERIPLTICETNLAEGTIVLIVQEVGATTIKLCKLPVGSYILDIIGPLGKSTEIKKYGKVICIGGGVGIAEIYPVAKALHAAGNNVFSIIGARTEEFLILKEQMRSVSKNLYLLTDDGSFGRKGFVSDVLGEILKKNNFDIVFAVGPVPMMAVVAGQTKPYKLKTIVSLNSIMVDGTGMCGSCRVTVGGEIKFVCVDGPDFDAHKVDFKELSSRSLRFKSAEKQCLLKIEKGNSNVL
ncbi:MAG: sulfide/dihydroorotate dehydrogenase-like FAD/NAD-binding protein [Candidatus Omnitrophota bacterium]|nr:MAG: sulfide/dihydroorotate dehydrogenase-like FAD/NAD-binding protein [Candidatus Omnitrophota bacterium]